MTPEQRYANIEAREKAATPGEWRFSDILDCDAGGVIVKQGNDWGIVCGSNTTPYNSHFIAHARADIPYLLGRVRRAEELLREIGKGNRHYHEDGAMYSDISDFLAGEGE